MEPDGQEQLDESGLPGPGAPTPLSALDVSDASRLHGGKGEIDMLT